MPPTPRGTGGIVRLSGVTRTYREGELSVAALKSVSLTLEPQCFSMLVGPSGSGKTSLLNIIGTIDRPDGGTVEIAGSLVSAMSGPELTHYRAMSIGFIFQNFNLMPVLTAYENVAYAARLAQLDAAEQSRRTWEILEAVGLQSFAKHRPNQLSGGQRQRVAIARALVKRPVMVLADEPTANLDSDTAAGIILLMREMQERYQTTFIFATHDQELMLHADRIVRLKDGHLIDDPSTDRAVAKPTGAFA